MASKRRKRATRSRTALAGGDGQISGSAQPRPREGTGRVLKRELLDAKSGHSVRFRNVAVTPLTLAHHRGHLDDPPDPKKFHRISGDDRLAAGEHFERHWRTIHASDMRGSSLEVSTRASSGLFWTESRQASSDEIARISRAMEHSNFAIVRAFCGDCLSLPDALRVAGVDVHPDGRAFRLREALNDLVRATHGLDRTLQHAPIRSYTAPDASEQSM